MSYNHKWPKPQYNLPQDNKPWLAYTLSHNSITQSKMWSVNFKWDEPHYNHKWGITIELENLDHEIVPVQYIHVHVHYNGNGLSVNIVSAKSWRLPICLENFWHLVVVVYIWICVYSSPLHSMWVLPCNYLLTINTLCKIYFQVGPQVIWSANNSRPCSYMYTYMLNDSR
jgi:hypothetical protein